MTDSFSVPTEPGSGRSTELVGELVALRPTKFDAEIETSIGRNEATFVEALIVSDESGDYRNLGEIPIFWEVVRRQLHDAKPWLAGTVDRQGRAYRMSPPDPDQMNAIRLALKRHADNPKPVETADESGDEEAPF